MITINICGSTPNELKNKFIEYAYAAYGLSSMQTEMPLAKLVPPPAEQPKPPATPIQIPVPAKEPAPAKAAAPAKKGRPSIYNRETAAEESIAAEIVAPAPKAAIANGAIKYQMQDTIEALKRIAAAKGIIVAKAQLAKFNCTKVSELKEAQYSEFVAVCDGEVATKQ